MNQFLDNSWQLKLGEAAESLSRGWQASTMVLGKICDGAERWQAAIRKIQAPVNFAEVVRARALPWVAGK